MKEGALGIRGGSSRAGQELLYIDCSTERFLMDIMQSPMHGDNMHQMNSNDVQSRN